MDKLQGPLRVLVALALVTSIVALSLAKEKSAESPSVVKTLGQSATDCTYSGVDSSFGRLGCSNQTRTRHGGSTMFIRPGQ